MSSYMKRVVGLALLLVVTNCVAATPEVAGTNVFTVTAASVPQLDAVFEASEVTPIQAKPKAWMEMTVLEAVAHGARVKAGDPLVRLDLDKLRDQVSDLEQDQPATAAALKLATAELENLKQTTPLKLEVARRSQRTAGEDLTYFEKTGRTAKGKAIEYKLKSAQQHLDNEAEELHQLEKMYKADDLVEESEEIILKRQKFAVEYAQYTLADTKRAAEWDLKTVIPREEELFKAQKRDQDLALALAEETLPGNLAKKQFEVEKLTRDQKKSTKRLADLRSDLEHLTLRAPVAGIVYYGTPAAGKWTSAGAMASKLAPGGKLAPLEVFMTIVNADKLILKATTTEANLSQFKAGMEGTATLVSQPDQKFDVRIEEIGLVPSVSGGFEVKLAVTGKLPTPVMPGMNCKVSFTKSAKKNALQVPEEAVFTEGDRRYVWILKADGQREKHAVKTGVTAGKMVQVTDGVAVGDKLQLAPAK